MTILEPDDLHAPGKRRRRPPRHGADRHPRLRHDGADDQRHVRSLDRRHPRLLRHHGRARRQAARPAAGRRLPGRLRLGHAARRHQRHAGHPLQDQRADRHAGDAVDLSRRSAARLRRRRHQYRQRLHDLRPDADPRHLLALLVHGGDRAALRLPGRPHPLSSGRPTTSAAMPGRRSCPASTSTARCSASSSSWGCSPASPARCSPRA